ncbi:LOG family protein [Paracoccus nototheniae]|uniref:AMP nucleosidase n=1 Tax=Paracoccus nototheniae TaxID=2489002 RepID=A0ABW4DT26_9RHOB|nr:LOG family protein [Paracoccus nototheniae]
MSQTDDRSHPIHDHPLPDSAQDAARAARAPHTPQTEAPSYRLAFSDPDFLLREELRPVRLQLELLKPQMLMDEHGINSTVVIFGGARIPSPERASEARTPELAQLSHFYTEARAFGRMMTERSLAGGGHDLVVCTGGGPGVMEAGNLGAQDAGGRSIGLSIVLPHEQSPNAYVTPELCFNFHYFAIRKMHFLMRARAITVFPGGFGTLDELFEALTLIQTRRMARVPLILFGGDFWREIVNWPALARAGTISEADLNLLHFVDTAAEAAAIIDGWPHDEG